jgi:hypothetical protein
MSNKVAIFIDNRVQIYMLIVALISGVILNPPALLWIGLVTTMVALYLHRPTIQHMFQQKVQPA